MMYIPAYNFIQALLLLLYIKSCLSFQNRKRDAFHIATKITLLI